MVLWYGLVCLTCDMVWPCGHRMVKYGLADIAWYMVWSDGHRMVYGYGLAGNAIGLA